MFKAEFTVEGLGAERALDKLVQGGVPVLSARKVQKNAVRIRVDGKHGKKVFAILEGPCYNITKVRPSLFRRLLGGVKKYAGLLAGAALFLAAVCFFQGRVLTVSVVGSGAYYKAEVLRALSAHGVGFLSPAPKEEATISAYLLTLPRVSFCSLSHEGGVLTVRVETEDEALPLVKGALLAPKGGVVEKITVVHGRALAAVGEQVEKGQPLVEEEGGYAAAYAAVRYAVDAVYAGSEASARAQAYLEHGEIEGIEIQETDEGWRITGSALAEAALNLG